MQGLGLVNVCTVHGYEYPKNYYRATVTDSDGKFEIYPNCFCSALAFGHISDTEKCFESRPVIEASIKTLCPEVFVVSVQELNREVTSESKANLGSLELKALNYWLPSTVGDVLFSWYFD